jgi:hypothetical protein
VCGLLGALVLGLYLVPRPFAMRLLDEHGPLETVSLGIYGLTGFRILRSPWFSARTRGLALAALALLVLFEVNPGGRLAHWVESPPEDPGAPGSLNLLGALAVTAVLILARWFPRGTTFLGALRVEPRGRRCLGWPFSPGLDSTSSDDAFQRYRGYRMGRIHTRT